MTFGTNGVLRPFVPGQTTGTAALQIGGDGGYFDSSLLQPAKGHQLFGRADMDLTDNLRAYVQLSANLKTNRSFSDPLRLTNSTFSATNAFLPAAYQAQLATAGLTTFRLTKLFGNDTRLDSIADSKQYVARGGLDGTIGDYSWGVAYQRSTAKLNTELANVPNNTNIARALDAVNSGGQIVCNITVTNPTLGAGCVPLNPFGPTAHSAAALAYVLTPTFYEAKTVMDDIGGHIEGAPFSTWAGPVNLSLSGEWRKLSFEATSTGTPSELVNCTNIRFNCNATGAQWGFSFANAPQVSQTVKEAAVEADVPLIKDVMLIQSLNVNAAARFTNYDTSGDYTTWKIGGDWHVNDDLRFRATKSRDIRAPTLYELFAPVNSVPINPVDLLTGLNPQVPSTDQSNPNLTAEVADTVTGGVVFRPTSSFSLALDGYHITISSAITQAAGSSPAYQQLCYASGGTSQWCQLQVRPLNYTNTTAANAVTRWYTRYLNFAEIETSGADLEVNYTASLFDHPASVRLLTAYQPHVYYRQEGAPTLDQGGVAFGATGLSAGPAWRVAGFARIEPFDGFTVDVLQRWRSGMKLGGDPTQVWVNNHMDSFATTNVTFTYHTKALVGDTALVFGIENAFNAEPPGGGYSGNGTRSGLRDGFALGDDVAGRQFTVGLRMRM
jgi:outer membrane receptor protein involved in Fe transport